MHYVVFLPGYQKIMWNSGFEKIINLPPANFSLSRPCWEVWNLSAKTISPPAMTSSVLSPSKLPTYEDCRLRSWIRITLEEAPPSIEKNELSYKTTRLSHVAACGSWQLWDPWFSVPVSQRVWLFLDSMDWSLTVSSAKIMQFNETSFNFYFYYDIF